jgi:muramoyltetrapeptide carboxypeptidase
LIGGNLTMIARLLGTPYLPDLSGSILFLEDVGEPPYRIDGLFAQLKHTGVFDRLGGLVIGHFSGWEPEEERPTLTYEEVISHYVSQLNIPVVSGLPYGHTRLSYALPIGVRARLVAVQPDPTLTILEALTT